MVASGPVVSDAGTAQPGFTLWPAQSPGTSQFNLANNGTEYFLSSNAADEAQHPVPSAAGSGTSTPAHRVDAKNTASLNTTSPAARLGIGHRA